MIFCDSKNLTQKTIIATDLKICKSISDQALGLLNLKCPEDKDEALF